MVLIDALQQTLIFIPLILGIYLTYQVLATTDLTPDGTFVLGAAIFARLITSGVSQTVSTIAALFGGLLAGLAVCALQRIAKINSLIASILAVFMLYSVNFAILNQPNISLLNSSTLLGNLQNGNAQLFLLVILLFAIVLFLGIFLLIRSPFGLTFRAFGVNKKLLSKLGKHPTFYLAVGLGLSNMMAALCGVMTAQINGYADINMGVGTALTGIGAVVIGCKLMRTLFLHTGSFSLVIDLMGCLLGGYLYFLMLNVFLLIGLNPIYLKLCLGLLLAVFLSTANYSQKSKLVLQDD
jgi:putative ABC transport system permease protein